MRVLLIALAGAAGALARYCIGIVAGPLAFPWATLEINVLGSFLLGALLSVRPRISETVATALAAGLLGAFTTFSTFSNETFVLFRTGRVIAAAGYIASSILLGVGAAALGYALTRALLK